MFFIAIKQPKAILKFPLDSLILTKQYKQRNIQKKKKKKLNLLNEPKDSKFVTKK